MPCFHERVVDRDALTKKAVETRRRASYLTMFKVEIKEGTGDKRVERTTKEVRQTGKGGQVAKHAMLDEKTKGSNSMHECSHGPHLQGREQIWPRTSEMSLERSVPDGVSAPGLFVSWCP